MVGISLARIQRAAEVDARRLGLEYRVEVMWGGEPGGDGLGGFTAPGCDGFSSRGTLAHAHVTEARRDGVARICVRRGLEDWRETVRHEVAHFAPGGSEHRGGHVAAMARAGSKRARRTLVATGRARCPKHRWETTQILERKVTSRGLVVTYRAACGRCGKSLGPKAA